MLDEGAGGRNALDLAEDVEQLGASLQAGVTWDAAQIVLSVLRDELPEALQLMADVAFRPDFPEAEVARVREERLTGLARGRDDPARIAANAFAALVFGEEHPYGRLTTQESTRGIDRSDLVEFHSRYYRPDASTLVLVGAVDPGLQGLIEQTFGSWERGTVPTTTVPPPPQIPTTRIFLVDKP